MDGDLLARADIDKLFLVVVFEEEEAGFGEVVGVKKLAERRATAPAGDAGCAGGFGLVEFSY